MKKKIIAINLVFAILFAPTNLFAKSFTDVKENGNTSWAYKYVDELSNKNILNGYEDGTFKPNNPVSFLETMQILKTLLNPSEDELKLARESNLELVNSCGVMDWAKDAVCYNIYHGTITEKTLKSARERGFLENKVYPNRNTIAVYFARAFSLDRNSDKSNLNYKDIKKIHPLTLEYLPSLVEKDIFTNSGSEGKFNGNLAIRRSEISVITSKSLKYLENNRGRIINNTEKDIKAEDLIVNPEENSKNISENSDSILLNKESENLEAAELNPNVNFKGEVVEIIESDKVNFIKIKIIESDSDKFNTGEVVTVNTFRKHNINDIVEGSGILGENSLTNIKLK